MTQKILLRLNLVLLAFCTLFFLMALSSSRFFPYGFGVDQSNPASALDVNGNATIGATFSGSAAAPANGALVFGDVGIGTSTVNTKLDVKGDLALREFGQNIGTGTSFNNLALNGDYSFIRLTGPTADFVINGITGGYDGRILIISNRTGRKMRFANEDAGSTAANRIYVEAGGPMEIDNQGAALLIYSATDSRWIAIGRK